MKDVFSRAAERAATRWRLTPRQSEVLKLLLRGTSNKLIAASLGCSDNTVKYHVSSLLRCFGARRRSELIAMVLGDRLALGSADESMK